MTFSTEQKCPAVTRLAPRGFAHPATPSPGSRVLRTWGGRPGGSAAGFGTRPCPAPRCLRGATPAPNSPAFGPPRGARAGWPSQSRGRMRPTRYGVAGRSPARGACPARRPHGGGPGAHRAKTGLQKNRPAAARPHTGMRPGERPEPPRRVNRRRNGTHATTLKVTRSFTHCAH